MKARRAGIFSHVSFIKGRKVVKGFNCTWRLRAAKTPKVALHVSTCSWLVVTYQALNCNLVHEIMDYHSEVYIVQCFKIVFAILDEGRMAFPRRNIYCRSGNYVVKNNLRKIFRGVKFSWFV